MQELNFCGGIYGVYLKDQIIYVGKTTLPFSRRFTEHKRKIDKKNESEKFYTYCYENKIKSDDLDFKILFDCTDCPLNNEQLECLETNYIEKYKPLCNEHKVEQRATILNFPKKDFPQLTKEQADYISYLFKNLTGSSFGVAILLLFFNDITPETINLKTVEQYLGIKRVSYYKALKDLKALQMEEMYNE